MDFSRASVCSCPSCKSEECFDKRNASCAQNEGTCSFARMNLTNQPICCGNSYPSDLVDCVTPVNSATQITPAKPAGKITFTCRGGYSSGAECDFATSIESKVKEEIQKLNKPPNKNKDLCCENTDLHGDICDFTSISNERNSIRDEIKKLTQRSDKNVTCSGSPYPYSNSICCGSSDRNGEIRNLTSVNNERNLKEEIYKYTQQTDKNSACSKNRVTDPYSDVCSFTNERNKTCIPSNLKNTVICSKSSYPYGKVNEYCSANNEREPLREKDQTFTQQSNTNMATCCTSRSIIDASQNNVNDKNYELIKAINETLSQSMNKEVRILLEQFRNSLIEINNKIKAHNKQKCEEKKNPPQCYSRNFYERTVTNAPDFNENIFDQKAETCQFHPTAKLNHLIQSAKVMKLDGGVEYRHEHIDRVDPYKKYAEHITKDEIITIKNYGKKSCEMPRVETKIDTIMKIASNKCCKDGKISSTCDKYNVHVKTNTSEKQELDVLKKPWTYMIIEDKGVGNDKPSYFILQQNNTSNKPEIKMIDDCACPSDQEQLLVSTQLAESLSSSTKTHNVTRLPENQNRPSYNYCPNSSVDESKNRGCDDLFGNYNRIPIGKQLTKVIPYTPEQIIRSNILTKPWKYMIIEDDEKSDKPSYFVLEQNEDSVKPEIKTVSDCVCPSEKQLIAGTKKVIKIPSTVKPAYNPDVILDCACPPDGKLVAGTKKEPSAPYTVKPIYNPDANVDCACPSDKKVVAGIKNDLKAPSTVNPVYNPDAIVDCSCSNEQLVAGTNKKPQVPNTVNPVYNPDAFVDCACPLDEQIIAGTEKELKAPNTVKPVYNPDAIMECACSSEEQQAILNTEHKTQVPKRDKLPPCQSNQSKTHSQIINIKSDCLCLKKLEEYIEKLEAKTCHPPETSNVCCRKKPELTLEERPHHVCNSLRPDTTRPLYSCKCKIPKNDCYASHCCNENDSVCLTEKIHAHTDRSKKESMHSFKHASAVTELCSVCKKYVLNTSSNHHQCCHVSSNIDECRYARLVVDDLYPACDLCGANRNMQYYQNLVQNPHLCSSCKKSLQNPCINKNNSLTNTSCNTSCNKNNACDMFSFHTPPPVVKQVLENFYRPVDASTNPCYIDETIPNQNETDETMPNQSDVDKEYPNTSAITTNDVSTSYDQIDSKVTKTPSIILKKLKEAYEACSCKLCVCSGNSRCDKATKLASTSKPEKTSKKKPTTCRCDPCECTNCKLLTTKTIRPNKLAVRGISKQPDLVHQNRDKEMFGVRNEHSCTCLTCDCYNCVKLKTIKSCLCKPCECLQCKTRECKNEQSCVCNPCRCTSCGLTKDKHTTQDSVNEMSQSITDKTDSEYTNTKDQNDTKNRFITLAALTDNQPHFLCGKNISNSCSCAQCECLVCDAQFCRLRLRELSCKTCKCSQCECEICSNRNTESFSIQCSCTVCECIACDTVSKKMPKDRQKKMLECFGPTCSCKTCVCERCLHKNTKPKCSSKINFLLPNDPHMIQSKSISPASTSLWSEDQSWSKTTGTISERISKPSSCIKRYSMDANDIPTKDEPNLFFSPEYDFIQELINYKTRSMTKAYEEKLKSPLQPKLFNLLPYPPSDIEPNFINDTPKLTHLQSAKAIYHRKRFFGTVNPSSNPPVERTAYKGTSSGNPHKSSLNLNNKCDNSCNTHSKGKWIKETDFVLRRLQENRSSNFALSYLKASGVQCVKTNDVLTNAKMFSLSLLKVLEKYERANQEFERMTTKPESLKEDFSIKDNTVKLDECSEYKISLLYQNQSDTNTNNEQSNNNETNIFEQSSKNGFVLDLRQINSLLDETSSYSAQHSGKTEIHNICQLIIEEIIILVDNSLSENSNNLSNVRTMINLFTGKSDDKASETMNNINYEVKNNALEIKSSRSLYINDDLGSEITHYKTESTVADSSNNMNTYKIISERKIKTDDDSCENTATLPLENIKFEPSVEENNEVEVTVSISTDDMISLRSMESNHVYVVNNNRHPIREFSEVPSLHILKKNARLGEALYPKLSPAYPSMQFDIKNTLHSIPRNNISESGPSGIRHIVNTVKIGEHELSNVETTTSKGFGAAVKSNHNSPYSRDESLKILEEESEILQMSNSPLILRKSISDKDASNSSSCAQTSASSEDHKAHFMSVMKISNHTILIKWNKPKSIEGVCGYELLIDGKPVKTNLNPSTCMAVVTCIPQAEKIVLTLRTIFKINNKIQHYPSDYTEYHPRINS